MNCSLHLHNIASEKRKKTAHLCLKVARQGAERSQILRGYYTKPMHCQRATAGLTRSNTGGSTAKLKMSVRLCRKMDTMDHLNLQSVTHVFPSFCALGGGQAHHLTICFLSSSELPLVTTCL